ncbi:hypothetical protein [Pacificoceanicola onchidii]|uniref:hypothetical protein n=1 Tax=Pacificoceanicola onchidii TaxID=2562685 RepID=UPI0010A463CD|nr:hypothetical protein [Pacificoceanicola onchidii]
MRAVFSVLCGCTGFALHAQEPELLPSFATCMDKEVARYERALRRVQDMPETQPFEIGDMRGTEFCGSVGIVTCDRSEEKLPCQHAFAEEQDALGARILATLPEPGAVQGRAGQWSDDLYPLVLALAQGTSAGPDCGGDTDVMAAWCEAREANRRLMNAVLAWQLARFLNAAPDAIEAGWAKVPPPVRPQARPDEN